MRIIWTHPARADVNGIWDYLQKCRPRAAELTESAILKAVDRLVAFPYLGRPGRKDGTRELVITGRPYIVIYGVVAETVVIFRVLHSAQNWPDQGSGIGGEQE
ncbi:MAG: type II toxin-antitoxin system RelE/ParE family toxin [Chloroflexota bacterium]|nr:type II toxin-antitoxin system RelE/ParE family toxin [Chloroflexota bacterium]